MSRDSSAHYLHLHHSHHADLLESFTNSHSSQLAHEEIYIPHHLQPVNPEDEDDVVPDQHAAFGIQRATQKSKEPAWKDLGLEELVRRGPGGGMEGVGLGGLGNGIGGAAVAGAGVGARGAGGLMGGSTGGGRRGEEPVVLALRRRPGAATSTVRMLGRMHAEGAGGGGGGAGNGLPR